MDQKQQTASGGNTGGYQEKGARGDNVFSPTSILPKTRPIVNSSIDVSDLDAAIAYHLERYWHFADIHRPWDAELHAIEYRTLYALRCRLSGGAL